MVDISIFSLIYRSKKYADWIHESVHRYTPLITTGVAEFYFVANDASEELVNYLIEKDYRHFINNNIRKDEEELFSLGYGAPEYINRVYCGYNFGITKAQGRIVILLNSDNCLSPDWLENLLKYLGKETIVTSQLVERSHPKFGVFPGAYHCEFGNRPDVYNESEFLHFVNRAKITGIRKGGAYMPCAFFKDKAEEVGLYPQGNIAGKNFSEVVEYGDQHFFRKLSNIGVLHVTALDSIVYHFKEGEMDDDIIEDPSSNDRIEKPITQSIGQINCVDLKPIAIMNRDGLEYLSFDKELKILKATRSLWRIFKRQFIRIKNRFI